MTTHPNVTLATGLFCYNKEKWIAKVSQLASLSQGTVEAHERDRNMLDEMSDEGLATAPTTTSGRLPAPRE